MTIETAVYSEKVRYLVFTEDTTVDELVDIYGSTTISLMTFTLNKLYGEHNKPEYGWYVINLRGNIQVLPGWQAKTLLGLEN